MSAGVARSSSGRTYDNRVADQHHREVNSMLGREDRLGHIEEEPDALSAREGDERAEDVRAVDDKLRRRQREHDERSDDEGHIVLAHALPAEQHVQRRYEQRHEETWPAECNRISRREVQDDGGERGTYRRKHLRRRSPRALLRRLGWAWRREAGGGLG